MIAKVDAAIEALGRTDGAAEFAWVRVAPIRAALEAAQQEREDWLDISAWESAGPVARTMTCDPEAKLCAVIYRHSTGPEFGGETFQEALHNAAAWCRAELAK